MTKKYIQRFLKQVAHISKSIDETKIDKIIKRIIKLKEDRGRIFFIGVGGKCF